MQIPIYQVDAFTDRVFGGNPAAVCVLESWLDDAQLQAIAAENNLAETAFLLATNDAYEIRWFTPVTEVPLCGHATLASAFVLFEYLGWQKDVLTLETRRKGTLGVIKRDGLLEMDLPAVQVAETSVTDELTHALRQKPEAVYEAEDNLLVTLSSEAAVQQLEPDMTHLAKLPYCGVCVTAKGDEVDFVSRFFAPRVGIPEDPVTGSAHCALAPFWAQRLGKNPLTARQISARGGELNCRVVGDRVYVAGQAVLYLTGSVEL